MQSHVNEAVMKIKSQLQEQPSFGLILGSGLGILADELEDAVFIPYQTIPHLPEPTVEGHKGQFVAGRLNGIPVLAMQGRFHYYEGYSLNQVTFPVRVMHALGITSLIVTNAAGGVNTTFQPGDLMIINDHINLLGNSPLIGPNITKWGPRFPDMSEAYDAEYRDIAHRIAKEQDLNVQTGVYLATSGPAYETPAEVRMIRILGADAVGMSTVPEVLVARHMGMRVLGISCISNAASGILDQPLSHDEVIETTDRVKKAFIQFVKGIVEQLPN